MEPVVPQPAFNRIDRPPAHSPNAGAEKVLKGVLVDKQPLNISEALSKLQQLPPPLRLLFAVHHTASARSEEQHPQGLAKPKTAPILMTPNLLKLILSVIERQLFSGGEQQGLLT